ncbi:MAG: AraC family transcriptional regulator [Limnochordia bacterium]|jgi:AraC-like DNA-binding protein|nr:AraC family transcriptional regulator [Limnochordia bacterium]
MEMTRKSVVKSTGYVEDQSQYWRINNHSNPHWQLMLVQGDNLHFQRGSQCLLLHEGHFLFLYPNEVHSSCGNTPSSGGFYFAQFSADIQPIGSKVYYQMDNETIVLPAHGRTKSKIPHHLFKLLILEANGREQYYRLRMTTIFTEILIDLARKHEAFAHTRETIHVASPKNAEVVHRIRRFIEQNYRKKLSAADISEGVHLSYEYACRTFRQAMDMTIVEYVNYLRIEEAQVLLLELREGQTIAEIAEFVGYSDPSYFSRVFRQHVGTSPSQYIKHAYGGAIRARERD